MYNGITYFMRKMNFRIITDRKISLFDVVTHAVKQKKRKKMMCTESVRYGWTKGDGRRVSQISDCKENEFFSPLFSSRFTKRQVYAVFFLLLSVCTIGSPRGLQHAAGDNLANERLQQRRKEEEKRK